jgi:hypothetical protein
VLEQTVIEMTMMNSEICSNCNTLTVYHSYTFEGLSLLSRILSLINYFDCEKILEVLIDMSVFSTPRCEKVDLENCVCVCARVRACTCTWEFIYVCSRAVWKVTSGELLTKQANNTYILKLLLNVVTTGIEALVISGNKFLYACVREVCRL